jgi:hypothetical protein
LGENSLRAIRIRLLALVVVCVASAMLAGPAGAQGEPDSIGFIGIPEYTSSETGIPFFDPSNAQLADKATADMRDAAAKCDKKAYDAALETLNSRIRIIASKAGGLYPPPKERRDAASLQEVIDRRPHFPKDCLPPDLRRAVDEVLHTYFFIGANVPLGVSSAVTGVGSVATGGDTFFGAGANQVDNRSSTSGNATPFAGLRFHAQATFDDLLEERSRNRLIEPSSPFNSLKVFVETGVQTAFGAQSSLQTFQSVGGTPQAFGSSTINENLQIPILAGVTTPIVPGGAGKPAVLFDLYGGITRDSWTQTLQGRESGAPGGPGFFAQNRRFTVDPTIGVGVRVPVGDIGVGIPGIIVGVNAELQFRPGSVVTTPSANFPSETYYGTVNPTANMAIMARIGIPLGGR